jgi:hypothetical protein
VKDDTFNTWAIVEILLFRKAIENEIFLSNDELSLLCNQLIEFCEKGLDVENLCLTVWLYLKSYPFPDFYGDLSNKFRGEFDYWFGGVFCFLLITVVEKILRSVQICFKVCAAAFTGTPISVNIYFRRFPLSGICATNFPCQELYLSWRPSPMINVCRSPISLR